MSFNAKNLTYESNDPSFLRKLRGEFGGSDSAHQQRPQARPKKLRNPDEEDDDQPVYVNDQDTSEIISKAEYDALLQAQSSEQQPVGEAPPTADLQDPTQQESLLRTSANGQESAVTERTAGIGGSSKKRSAKVVGDDGDSDEAENPKIDSRVAKKSASTKKKKKGKKLKLSFEDD